jgi:hypothetical protein
MRKSVLAVLLAVAAVALAAKTITTTPPIVNHDPAATSIGTTTPANSDPRVAAIRAQQEQAVAQGDEALARRLEAQVQGIYLEYQSRPGSAAGATVVQPWQFQSRAADLPDVMIDSGIIRATAADYEMDGTMWVAYSKSAPDSWVRIVRSTDHGQTWDGIKSFRTNPTSIITRLGMVVGQGDSGFVYVFVVHPNQNGDLLCVRFNKDGSNYLTTWGKSDADTVNDFKVCRDYSGGDYWLYAVAGNSNHTATLDDYVLRSTDYGVTWASTKTFRFVSDGSYQSGSGRYQYLSGHTGYSPYKGNLNMLVNTRWGNPDSWREAQVAPDTFPVYDQVMAPSFATPVENAVVWTLYTHDFQGTGDFDVKYVYSTDAGVTWSTDYYMAGSSSASEAYGDIKPYADPGNTWMNASYISEESYRTVYRRFCEQSTPTAWSDTERINTHSAGTGQPIRPLLVYSPGAPGTGAGCVFTGAGLNNIYWNAPWLTGLAEERRITREAGFTVSPNPAAEQVRFTVPRVAGSRLVIYDAAGREVTHLPADAGMVWNRTDARGNRVPAGVYLVRLTSPELTASRRLVLR